MVKVGKGIGVKRITIFGDQMEEWRAIDGYPGYEVSDLGRVRSLLRSTPTILKPWVHMKGYLVVHLFRDGIRQSKRTHRLVAEAFNPNPDSKPEVNHKDRNKQNNHSPNLEWVTTKENAEHNGATNLLMIGYVNPNAKLKDGEVWLVRRLLKSRRATQATIAQMFRVSQSTIRDIALGKSYKSIGLESC